MPQPERLPQEMDWLVSEQGSCASKLWNVFGLHGPWQGLRLETGAWKDNGFVVCAISVVWVGGVRGSWSGKIPEGLESVGVVVAVPVVQRDVAKNTPICSRSRWSIR